MSKNNRMWLAAGALAVLLPFGVAVVDAAGMADPVPGRTTAIATDLDGAIDMVVQHRVASQKLSAASALIAREQLQLQFLAMPAEARAKVLALAAQATSEENLLGLVAAMNSAVAEAARQQVDDARNAQIAAIPGGKQAAGEMAKKLGIDGDLVFVATAGPCRVADTRLGIYANWPGKIGGFTGRQIWAFSWFAPYDFSSEQGGTGIAGSGNCAGTVFPTTYPVSVVATIAVVNTTSTGYLRAWNGGTTLTVGGILGWNAGDVLSNTTVIPLNRSIVEYPGSGPYKRDFAVYNNSSTSIDVVVDVVGYFIPNQATPLDCTEVYDAGNSIPANSSILVATPACPTGYTPVAGVTSLGTGRYASTLNAGACRLGNLTGGALPGNCGVSCCRVPGR